MNTCPDCGAHLPDGMSCRELYDQVMAEEYMVMAPRTDYLAAQKLASVCYLLQHPREHTPKQLAFGVRLLEMVIGEGYSPLDAAEDLLRQFACQPPLLDNVCLPDEVDYPLHIANFRRWLQEPYLDSAYRWSRSIFEQLGCAEASGALHLLKS